MFNLGTAEIIIIAAVIIMLFGADKIPELAKGIGRASREFRRGLTGEDTPPKHKKKTADSAPSSESETPTNL